MAFALGKSSHLSFWSYKVHEQGLYSQYYQMAFVLTMDV